MGRLIVVCSGKGGVGKSTFSANLGATYAMKGLKVAMVDMNLGLRNLDIYMGLESKVVYDIGDVLDGTVRLRKALVRDKRLPSLYLLATTQRRAEFKPEPAAIFSLFIELKHKFDVVIIDAPAGIGEGFSLSILGADVAVLVTTPDYVALRDADHINNLLRERGIKNRAYVVNKADKTFLGADSLPSVENIISMMHIDLLGIIQSDNNIHLSGSRGRPYVMSGASYVKRNFQKIADRIFRF